MPETKKTRRELSAELEELRLEVRRLRKVEADLETTLNFLAESEERYRHLVEDMNEVIFLLNDRGEFIYVSPSAERLLGYQQNEVIGRPFSRFVHSDDVVSLIERFQGVMSGGILAAEYRIFAKSGEIRWVRSSSRPVSEGGKTVGLQGILSDITDRRRAEEALSESEERYRGLFENAPVGIIVTSFQGDILTCNDRMAAIAGYSEEELKEVNVKTVYKYPEERNALLKRVEREGRVHNYELELLRKNGDLLFTSLNIQPFTVGGQKAILSIVQDISESKRAAQERQNLEKQLQHAQKMEALGTLAGGIAHDLNNALGIIMANGEFLRTDFDRDDPVSFNLELILKAANRSRDLVRQILTFSRRSEEGFITLNIDPLLREAIKMLRSSLPATIEISQNISAKSANIYADPAQIHQVIVNLGANAAQAMQNTGGILEIHLSRIELDHPFPTRCQIIGPGGFLKLTVKDTGQGMDKTTLEKIFDPFFTTKKTGRGTGMGLAVIHGIVLNHNGGITVSSQPGAGTIIDVYLPLVKEDTGPPAKSVYFLPTGTENILLVDDEVDMIHSVSLIFKRLGYKVDGFSGGPEALKAFQSEPDKYRIVITDQTMPEMTGLELTEHVLAVRPDMPVIICTGFNDAIDEMTKDRKGIREVLIKPISLSQWANTIRRVLDETE